MRTIKDLPRMAKLKFRHDEQDRNNQVEVEEVVENLHPDTKGLLLRYNLSDITIRKLFTKLSVKQS